MVRRIGGRLRNSDFGQGGAVVEIPLFINSDPNLYKRDIVWQAV
jgi:hypothetical protein